MFSCVFSQNAIQTRILIDRHPPNTGRLFSVLTGRREREREGQKVVHPCYYFYSSVWHVFFYYRGGVCFFSTWCTTSCLYCKHLHIHTHYTHSADATGFIMINPLFPKYCWLTLSCPGKGRAVVKVGHSNLWPGSKELWGTKVILCLILYFPGTAIAIVK